MLKSKKQALILISISGLVLILALFRPLLVRAAGLVPCGGVAEKPCTVADAFYGAARVTNWLILMAGVYAVYVMLNASIWLVISMGNEETITKQRKRLTDAIAGFFLVVAAFMMMNTVVNGLLRSKCLVNFSDPLTYVTLKDPSKCIQPSDKNFNPVNKDLVPGGNGN